MLLQVKKLENLKLRALDGDIGKVREFYFDDKFWTVRYLVADTGGWLSGRQVLISPYALRLANEAEHVLSVDLTEKQIEESPSLATDAPVSRQYEMQYYGYYGWPAYWNGSSALGASSSMLGVAPGMGVGLGIGGVQKEQTEPTRREEAFDPNLRSMSAVTGYHIQAKDGEIGHVADFIIDDETWAIRYLVVDTKNWWPGRHVLISPQWIGSVSWEERKVFVNLSCEAIKQSPEFMPESLDRDYELALHQHYDRQGYWTDEKQRTKNDPKNIK